MSNSITPFTSGTLPETAPPATPGPADASRAPASPQAAAQSETVTLSAAAQASTQLLASARTAGGIDNQAVASIRAQIANGSYNVSPENLAQAIASVLKETNS